MKAAETLSVLNQGITLYGKIKNTVTLSHSFLCRRYKVDYIILNFQKHVTVYGNGNGIIMVSFDFYVSNPGKMQYINMRLNIEDACYGVIFKKLETLSKCPPSERFSETGFWYSCTGECVEKVEEYYWRDDGEDGEDPKIKANKREIRYRFRMRPENMKRGGVYSISYSFSIPGMYPITNCKYNPTIAASQLDRMESTYNVRHRVRRAEYILSFEKGIEFTEPPKGEVKITQSNAGISKVPLSPENISSLFYRKYKYVVKNPKFDSYIGISWKVS